MDAEKHIVVVGGGASGLMAAISAVREGVRVTLVEESAHVGKPILATGNGRCNLTNAKVSADAYNHPEFVSGALDRFDAEGILAVFAGLGLVATEEDDGRVYPFSRTANSVVDVLRGACTRLGVEVHCGLRVRGIRQVPDGGFRVLVEDGEPLRADSVIVATGGGSELLASLGHEMRPFRPVLCSLATDTAPLRGLDGVRAHALVSACHEGAEGPFASEYGEVLFRKYGVSGIVVFDLSRTVEAGDILSVDLLPGFEVDEATAFVQEVSEHMGEASGTWGMPAPTYAEVFAGLLQSRIAGAVLRSVQLKASLPATAEGLARTVRRAKDFRLQVTGIGDARHAQVTRGGAALGGFDPQTLESRTCPRLYACGEVLDVDGPCGGYNLHWAWASGLVAGAAAAR